MDRTAEHPSVVSDIRYVTVSEMQDYLKDEWRWFAKWILNRVPRRWSNALILGTMVHDILEMYFSGGEPILDNAFDGTVVVESTRKFPDPDHAAAHARALKQLHTLRDQVLDFKDIYPGETLAVEEVFELPFWPESPSGGGRCEWVFRGRRDRVVRLHSGGRVVHMQHKTLAGNRPVDLFVRSLARSMHETLYGYDLSRRYGGDYAGSIINVIRKKPGAKGFQALLPLAPADLERAWMRARTIVSRMSHSEAVGREHGIWALVDNPQNDAGVFGNSLDGYVPVLEGKASLDDPNLFMTREETY